MRALLRHPMLVWLVLFVLLLTLTQWPAKGWRDVARVVLLAIVFALLVLAFLR